MRNNAILITSIKMPRQILHYEIRQVIKIQFSYYQ